MVWFSLDDFIQELNAYIHWYNHNRIKLSLDGLNPLKYRHKFGLFASPVQLFVCIPV